MSDKTAPFKVPVGRMVNVRRYHVKRPRIVSFHVEGNNLMAVLSCGHVKKYCRVPKWTQCYDCKVETTISEEPTQGFKEIPFTTEIPQ